jgi:hypothetical protein
MGNEVQLTPLEALGVAIKAEIAPLLHHCCGVDGTGGGRDV